MTMFYVFRDQKGVLAFQWDNRNSNYLWCKVLVHHTCPYSLKWIQINSCIQTEWVCFCLQRLKMVIPHRNPQIFAYVLLVKSYGTHAANIDQGSEIYLPLSASIGCVRTVYIIF